MTRCGPYQLLEPVGEGSSGTVYRARRDGEERDVALKLLTHQPPPRWVAHLKTLGEHLDPHLCALLDVGQDDERSYLVYAYLPGGDLETARDGYDDRRVPLRTALRWSIDALKGLSAVHQAGFLHGDIKPSNLMLDGEKRVVVCDFTTLTPRDGPLALDLENGTPAYLPPDKTLLRSPRRDLYALGLTLHGLLVGQLPASPEAAVPSAADPLLPAAVDEIVARALGQARPFETAAEMRQAMENLLLGPQAVAVESSLSPPTRRVAWQTVQRQAPVWPWLVALLMLPLGVWARGRQPETAISFAPTALWTGVGVSPVAFQNRELWRLMVLGRPVLGFCSSDRAAGGESAKERAEWCAAVIEEAHFQKRPLSFAYRREGPESCDVYLVGKDWPEKFLFRITPAESKLFDRPGPFLARAWTALLADTAELARPGSRAGEKSAGALMLQPWRRRYETLAGQNEPVDQPARVALWLEALRSLEGEAHSQLLEAYSDLPEAKDGK